MSNFLSRRVISCDDSVHSGLSTPHTLRALADDQHMLFVFIVRLRRCVLLLRVLSSDKNLATSLFLETLLVEALRTNKHSDIVHSSVLRNVYLLLDLRGVLERVQDRWIQILEQFGVLSNHDGRVRCVQIFHFFRHQLARDFLIVRIRPLVFVLPFVWLATRDVDVLGVCCGFSPIVLEKHSIFDSPSCGKVLLGLLVKIAWPDHGQTVRRSSLGSQTRRNLLVERSGRRFGT